MPLFFRSLALAALLVAASAPAAPAGAHNALWSFKGKSNTIYLLGSVHYLQPTDALPGAIDTAYRDAERIIMEIDMDDLDPLEAQRLTLELGMLPDGQTLEAQLGPNAYEQVATQARAIGVDPALLNRFRPWLAAMTLVQLQLMKQGLDPHSGVEQRLTARAAADGKQITGLETIEQQLGMLAGLPAQQQREFLMYSVEDVERAAQEVDELIAAWRTGDTRTLSKLLSEGFEKYPDLYRPLTIERNRRWIPNIEALLDDADDYLIVVGALHLVGKDSVIDLLERKGHRITQH
jgi:uncharacterized protein YbaP (TraB family)